VQEAGRIHQQYSLQIDFAADRLFRRQAAVKAQQTLSLYSLWPSGLIPLSFLREAFFLHFYDGVTLFFRLMLLQKYTGAFRAPVIHNKKTADRSSCPQEVASRIMPQLNCALTHDTEGWLTALYCLILGATAKYT